MLAALAFIGFGLAPTYPHLLIAMAFVGLANSVFHPADYAILSAIARPRVGRAFSIHTFAGFLGNADRAGDDARGGGQPWAQCRADRGRGVALFVAVPLMLARGVDTPARRRIPAAAPAGGRMASPRS